MRILTINAGSSSIKFGLHEGSEAPFRTLAQGKIDHIGLASAVLVLQDEHGTRTTQSVVVPDMTAASELLVATLREQGLYDALTAVAHRVVHGGHFTDHARITPAVVAEIQRFISYDPTHLPHELALINTLQSLTGTIPHIACFDTVFHRTLPEKASRLAIPREYHTRGIKRYGFHGLSYEYLHGELARIAGERAANGKVIMLHLGNGASITALSHGASIDTTMAFSPTSGIPMGTRSGDLDPGVVRYLLTEGKLTPDALDTLLTTQSGLLGMSGTTYDMEALLAEEAQNPAAHAAIESFCYAVQKQIGAYTAALGGLDTLVFSGGMGEQSAPIRGRIAAPLAYLGVVLDDDLNTQRASLISRPDAPVGVYVIPTNEEARMCVIAARLTN